MSAQRPNPKKYIIGAIAIVVVFVLICVGRFFYNDDDYDRELTTLRWPSSGIAQLLPMPETTKGHTYWETNTGFDIDVGDYSYEMFSDYVEACKLNGFNVDFYSNPHSFSAKNEDGYELYLYYYEDSNVMSISLSAPPMESAAEEAEEAASDADVSET